MYSRVFSTSNWHEGDCIIRVEAKATGFTSELTTFALEAVEPFVEEPGFGETQGPKVTDVVIVIAVIAIAAAYKYGRKTLAINSPHFSSKS